MPVILGIGGALGLLIIGAGVGFYVSGKRKQKKILTLLQESTLDLGIDLVCLVCRCTAFCTPYETTGRALVFELQRAFDRRYLNNALF